MLQVFDIIGPVMIGPSSSHTAGAVRIGKYARIILGETPEKASIRFSGSFAQTYKGHGTDRAVVAGILGMDTDDDRIPDSMILAEELGLDFCFIEEDIDNAHPNTVEIVLEDGKGAKVLVQGASVGGGNILINKINDTVVAITGKSDTLIITHKDVPGVVAEITAVLAEHQVNIHGLSLSRDCKGGTAVVTIELDGEVHSAAKEGILEAPNVISSTVLKAI